MTAPTAAAESLALRFETAHFRMHAGRTPDTTLRAAADRLEAWAAWLRERYLS